MLILVALLTLAAHQGAHAVVVNTCAGPTTCDACVRDILCAFCASTLTCVPATTEGRTMCASNTGTFAMASTDCRCLNHTSCSTCRADNSCGFCPTAGREWCLSNVQASYCPDSLYGTCPTAAPTTTTVSTTTTTKTTTTTTSTTTTSSSSTTRQTSTSLAPTTSLYSSPPPSSSSAASSPTSPSLATTVSSSGTSSIATSVGTPGASSIATTGGTSASAGPTTTPAGTVSSATAVPSATTTNTAAASSAAMSTSIAPSSAAMSTSTATSNAAIGVTTAPTSTVTTATQAATTTSQTAPATTAGQAATTTSQTATMAGQAATTSQAAAATTTSQAATTTSGTTGVGPQASTSSSASFPLAAIVAVAVVAGVLLIAALLVLARRRPRVGKAPAPRASPEFIAPIMNPLYGATGGTGAAGVGSTSGSGEENGGGDVAAIRAANPTEVSAAVVSHRGAASTALVAQGARVQSAAATRAPPSTAAVVSRRDGSGPSTAEYESPSSAEYASPYAVPGPGNQYEQPASFYSLLSGLSGAPADGAHYDAAHPPHSPAHYDAASSTLGMYAIPAGPHYDAVLGDLYAPANGAADYAVASLLPAAGTGTPHYDAPSEGLYASTPHSDTGHAHPDGSSATGRGVASVSHASAPALDSNGRAALVYDNASSAPTYDAPRGIPGADGLYADMPAYAEGDSLYAAPASGPFYATAAPATAAQALAPLEYNNLNPDGSTAIAPGYYAPPALYASATQGQDTPGYYAAASMGPTYDNTAATPAAAPAAYDNLKGVPEAKGYLTILPS
eukprot:m.259696 g.259696  ORF g.259696 m.259696 type:complete len:792 (+) comp22837_c0_seq1:1-2376(+)